MKTLLLLVSMFLLTGVNAASVSWSDFYCGAEGGYSDYPDAVGYHLFGEVTTDQGGYAGLYGYFAGYENSTGFYLKAYDYSRTGLNVDTRWVLGYYGAVFGAESVDSFSMLPHLDYKLDQGGMLIEDRTDFYLGLRTGDVFTDSGDVWYAWVRLCVDDSLHMTILDSGINLAGGAVVMGQSSPTPEPSTSILLTMGLLFLALRRKI